MQKTKVSRAVAQLEKRRLLVRRANRDDMREAFLSLTAAGRTDLRGAGAERIGFRPPIDRKLSTRATAQHSIARSTS